MLKKIGSLMSKRKLHRMKPDIGRNLAKWNGQKRSKKMIVAVLFVFVLASAVGLLNYMNRAKADWNNNVQWTTTGDFANNAVTTNTATTFDSSLINIGSDKVELKNSKVVSMAAGYGGTLVVKEDGTLWGVGKNTDGSLGLGDLSNKTVFTQAAGINNAVSVSMGVGFSLYIDSGGNLYATGSNANYELGLSDNATRTSWTPTGLTNVSKVSAGHGHSIALKNDGTLWMSGETVFGVRPYWLEFGTPGDYYCQNYGCDFRTNHDDVVGISAHGMYINSYSTVIMSDGSAWGIQPYNPSSNNHNDAKKEVQNDGVGLVLHANGETEALQGWGETGLTNVADIAVGRDHAMALKNDGTVWVAGDSSAGMLGDGVPPHLQFSWLDTGITGATQIAAGEYYSLILKSDGTVIGAGQNTNCQLGVSCGTDQRSFVDIGTARYTTGAVSGYKIDAGVGVKYKWNSISWAGTTPANTAIKFRARGATTEGGLASASWSSYFTNSGASLLGIAASRWLEVEATLVSTNGLATPTLNDFTVNYFTDITAPIGPTAPASAWTSAGKTTPVSNDSFLNVTQPYFEFSGASDEVDGSALAGYYVYFGQTVDADPFTAGTYQVHNVTDPQTFIPVSPLTSEGTYYLRVVAIDNAGNTADPVQLFTYKFDKTAPTSPVGLDVDPFGWSVTNSFNFNWSAAFDEVGVGQSGVAGYQYKLCGTVNDWSGTIVSTDQLSATGITACPNGQGGYINGISVLYLRSIDNAGNFSGVRQVNYRYSGDAPSKPRNLTRSPESSTSNSFTFEWDAPLNPVRTIAKYRYSVNAVPNANNTTEIDLANLPPEVTVVGGHVTLANIPAATQQDLNTFYVVAVDEGGAVAYGVDNYSSTDFECNAPAPGAPTAIELFDTSNKEAAKYSVTIAWVEPIEVGIGVAGYAIERSDDDGQTYVEVGRSSGTTFMNTGLATADPAENPSLYSYRVRAYNNANSYSVYTSIKSITPTGRWTIPPDIDPEGPPTATPKVSTALVTWQTSRRATSFVQFGKTTDYGIEQGDHELKKIHEVGIVGLDSDTVYHYRVGYIDDDGNVGYSSDLTFKTQPAPRVERVSVQDVRLYNAVLTWYTSEPATSDLMYGKSSN
ncbi:MAG: hypothetical protein WCP11_02670, partial [Candidatus Saccharibacteria bacterium]